MSQNNHIQERPANRLVHWSIGFFALLPFLALGYAGWTQIQNAWNLNTGFPWMGCLLCFVSVIGFVWMLTKFEIVAPYQRVVISLFGEYIGVDGREGLSWLVPFYAGRTVSTALSNFETEKVKVNDRGGSPIDIAAVVVTRIIDPAKAIYNVQDVNEYVRQQVVAGIRTVAASHDYDGEESKAVEDAEGQSQAKSEYTLRSNLNEIAEELRTVAQQGIGDVGVELVDVRITHLAYAPEIAAAMLKRQQAKAVVAARETIVTGAVTIVEETMKKLDEKGMKIDEDRRATLTSNLLIVLSSDREAAPVLPVGA